MNHLSKEEKEELLKEFKNDKDDRVILEKLGNVVLSQTKEEKKCREMLRGLFAGLSNNVNKIVLFLPKTNQIATLVQGKGGNLTDEEKSEGYVGYIKYYISDFDGKSYFRGDSGTFLYRSDRDGRPLKEQVYDVMTAYCDDFCMIFKDIILLFFETNKSTGK